MFAAITAIRCVVRRVKIVSGFALAIAVNALTSRQLLAANRDRVGPPIFIAYDVEPVFEVAALPLLRCDGFTIIRHALPAGCWIETRGSFSHFLRAISSSRAAIFAVEDGR